MKLQGKHIILIVSTIVLLTVLTMNFTGGFSMILPTASNKTYCDPVSIDLLTMQSLIKTISWKEIPAKTFIEAIDSLNQTLNVNQVHNPFIKRNVQISRTEPTKQKAFTTSKKKVIKKRPKVTVNGIVWDEDNPYAILNGEIYRIGDRLKGYSIQAILKTMVVFSSPEDEFILLYNRE